MAQYTAFASGRDELTATRAFFLNSTPKSDYGFIRIYEEFLHCSGFSIELFVFCQAFKVVLETTELIFDCFIKRQKPFRTLLSNVRWVTGSGCRHLHPRQLLDNPR